MKRYLISIVLLVLSVGVFAQGKEPMVFSAFNKAEVEKTDGILPVYRMGDKCYLEIPVKMLGREMFLSGCVVRGTGLSYTLTEGLGVVVFKMEPGHRVSLSKGILGERVSDTTSGMYKLMSERVLEPVDFLYNVVAYGADGKSPIVDITALVKSSPEWFGSAERGAIDASKCEVTGVERLEDGVKFSVVRVHSFAKQGFMGIPGKEGITPIEMACIIRVLPEKSMVVRYADPRVGYRTLSYLDYGRNPQGVEKMSLIYKWNLSIAPEDQALVERNQVVAPEKPIVFYISQEVPERFRPAIREGILAWQVAFEQAGFKGALQVKDADQTVDLALADAVVTCSPTSGGISSSILAHPRTGEILKCRLNISYYFIQSEMANYLLQCGMVDERIVNDRACEALAMDILRYRVSSEVAKVFGLLPNYAASMAFTAKQMRDPKWLAENGYTVSVTDELPFNYAVQPGDGVNVKDLIPRVGSYDRWAITWGYKQYSATPDPEQDKKVLDQLCQSVRKVKVLRYRGYDKVDPLGTRGDLGKDRVAVVELGMKNLERIYPRLEEITAKTDGESWEELKGMYSQVHSLYNDYLKNVGGLIGGRYTAPVIKGSDERPVSYVSRKEQKEAMEFLNRYLFAGIPTWYNSELSVQNGWLTAEEMLRRFADSWLKEKLEEGNIEILFRGEVAGGKDAYSVKEFFADLDRMIFDDYKVSGVTSVHRKNMQYSYVKGMVEGMREVQGKSKSDEYSMVMVMHTREMKEKLEQLGKSHPDAGEGAYFRSLAAKLKK